MPSVRGGTSTTNWSQLVSGPSESVNTLWARFYAHVDELVAQDAADPAARPVSIVVAGLPRLGETS